MEIKNMIKGIIMAIEQATAARHFEYDSITARLSTGIRNNKQGVVEGIVRPPAVVYTQIRACRAHRSRV
jgi:hypothetical protein